MSKFRIIVLLLVIVLLGGILRYRNLYIWPREGATFDEFAWAYLGVSLINQKVPISWSPHKQYTDFTYYKNPDHTTFRLVRPYLEHPPFFGLIVGLSQTVQGITEFDKVDVRSIRPLAFVIGIVSIGAAYFFASSFYNWRIGLVSAGVYAIFPTIAIGSRILQNENFFIPLFLISLGLARRYVVTKNRQWFYGVCFLSFLLPLSKVPWLASPLAVFLYFLSLKKWKEAFIVAGSAGAGLAFFFAYGLYYGKDIFLGLWKLQLARYDLSFGSFYKIFLDPLIVDRQLIDGWVYMGWIVLFVILAMDYKKHMGIITGFFSYLLVFLFAIPSETSHGWYRFPFYPFFAVAFGFLFSQRLEKMPHILCPILTLLGLSLLEIVWIPPFGFSFTVHRAWLLLCTMMALPLFIKNSWTVKIGVMATYVVLLCIALLSMITIYQYNEQ